MSQLNTVSAAMDPQPKNPSVYFFGWDQERKGLTENYGQPKGELHEMTLDSMKHAIIVNQGDFKTYTIKIGLPAGFQEYVLILNLPRIVFVARYFASNFHDMILKDFCEEMNFLSGRMNAKIQEIDKKDPPYDWGALEGSELAIYHPAKIVSQHGGEMPHDDMTDLRHKFKNNAVRLTMIPYGPKTCTLVIKQGNTGAPATHSLV